MTRPIGISCAMLLAALPLSAASAEWTHDFAAAKKQAAEEEKALLINFTGSDWCGWCIKLKDEVFDHDEFKDDVTKDFVLTELDFPQDKSKLSEETQQQNAELQKEYGIRGFPTILLTDATGKPFARTGYQAGGPEAYNSHLDELLAKREQRDEALAKAEKLEGVPKAQALVDALSAMQLEDAMVSNFYGEVVDEIKAADPEDETGFVKQVEMKSAFAEFQQELGGIAQTGDHAAALAFVDKTIESGDFEGEPLQQITLIKSFVLAEMKEFDKAIENMDVAKALDPDSPIAQQIDQLKGRLEQARDEAAAGDSAP